MEKNIKHDLPEFLSIGEALRLPRLDVRKNYKEYINPGLASMMGLLNLDKQFVRAEGVSVWDSEGNEYLDFLGGYGALNLGHNHPAITDAIEQVKTRPSMLQASLEPVVSALAHNLALITPGGLQYSFFGNSGAEAVEGALKLARIATGRKKIVYCHGSFHGKSFGALSVTGRDKYQEPFKPLLPGCESIPYDNAAKLEEKLHNRDVAAFIVEPIQGEGGMIVPREGYLCDVKRICSKYGTLLIIDEIQTGFGRTGKMFACEYEGIEPDIMCVAKSFGGGVMPLGAFIATGEVWRRGYGSMETCLLHTSTFGGNIWAAAAGIAAIQTTYDLGLADEAREKGEYFLNKLKDLQAKHPLIKEVRGKGLMIGIKLAHPSNGLLDMVSGGMLGKFANEYLGAMVAGELQNKYRIITAYTLNDPAVIRLEPPLIVTREQIDRAVAALDELFRDSKSFLALVMNSTKTVVNALLKK